MIFNDKWERLLFCSAHFSGVRVAAAFQPPVHNVLPTDDSANTLSA